MAVLAALAPWLWLSGSGWRTSLSPAARLWARDRWLWVLAWVGVVGLWRVEPALGCMSAVRLLRWAGPEDLPGLLTWAGAVGTWILAREVPVAWRELIGGAWVGYGVVTAGLLLAYAAALHRRFPSWPLRMMNEYAGTFGQRTLAAAFLALVYPLALLLPPWAALLSLGALTLGLWCAWSWTALLAAGIGLAVAVPWAGPGVLAGAALVVGTVLLAVWRERSGAVCSTWLDRWTSRGDSRDSLRIRWRSVVARWRLWRQWPWWLVGRGPGAAQADAIRAEAAWRLPIILGPIHNDLVEWVYDHGLPGLFAACWFGLRVAPGLHVGDPWTAAILAGLVLACGTYALQVPSIGLPWWIALAWRAP